MSQDTQETTAWGRRRAGRRQRNSQAANASRDAAPKHVKHTTVGARHRRPPYVRDVIVENAETLARALSTTPVVDRFSDLVPRKGRFAHVTAYGTVLTDSKHVDSTYRNAVTDEMPTGREPLKLVFAISSATKFVNANTNDGNWPLKPFDDSDSDLINTRDDTQNQHNTSRYKDCLSTQVLSRHGVNDTQAHPCFYKRAPARLLSSTGNHICVNNCTRTSGSAKQ